MESPDVVEQDHIFQLAGIADDGVFAHDRIAAHEGTLAQLRAMVNDAGAGDIGAVKNLGIARDPDILAALLIDLRVKRRSQG